MIDPSLREALASPDVYARRDAARIVLGSRNSRDRLLAIRAVANWQWELSSLLVGPLLLDPVASIRRACASALGEAIAMTGAWAITKGLGCWHDVPASDENVAALCEALRDSDPGVREAAARALCRLSEAKDCVRSKGGLWGDDFRKAVARMCEDALAPLAAMYAKDRSPRARRAALLALARLGWPEAVAPLVALIAQNTDHALTAEAICSLHAGGAKEALVPLALHADPFVRASAAAQLGLDSLPWTVHEVAIEALIADLADPALRDLAARALATSRDARVIAPFVAILRAPNVNATLASAAVLGLASHRDDPRVVEALIGSLLARPQWYTAYVLCGVVDERVIAPLAAFVRGGCEAYQASQVGAALKQIGGPRAEACLRELGSLIPEEVDYDPYD